MIVYIDRQHTGKPNRPSDRGAGVDVDGNGKIETWENESHWTGYLAVMLESRLVLHEDIQVIPIQDGTYLARHSRVNEYSKMFKDEKQVYLALHLNAGGGNYGSMFYHHDSQQGRSLATYICEGLGNYCSEIPTFKAIPATSEDWTNHAFNTIKGVGRPVAICCEPLFMDTHKRFISMDGFGRVALGITTGILNWRNSNV